MFFVGTGGVFSGDITGCIRIVRFEVNKYAGVMALSASIFKATVRIDDMDRSHYGTYSLTLARHPSETDERMMVRLLAFMCYADERLSFTKGLSETDEPDLWMHDLQGQVALWIETGTPTLRRVVSACRKAENGSWCSLTGAASCNGGAKPGRISGKWAISLSFVCRKR